MSKQLFYVIFAAWLLMSIASPAMGQQVQVLSDPARFDIQAKAPALPIPDSQRAFPGSNCGSGDRGPTGLGSTIVIPFGANQVTITGAQGQSLCIFDGGTMVFSSSGGLNNTQPNFMTANTIVGNDQKDLRFVFGSPVQAVAFRFLTNNVAQEVATFKDVAGNILSEVNIDRFTPRNDRVFVGFISRRPFKEVVLVINRGIPPVGQNEGIDAIKVGETASTDQVPSEESQLLTP